MAEKNVGLIFYFGTSGFKVVPNLNLLSWNGCVKWTQLFMTSQGLKNCRCPSMKFIIAGNSLSKCHMTTLLQSSVI